MTEALINPRVLLWARARTKMEPDTLAEKAHVKLNKVLLWEKGDTRPTFRQAQDLAQVLHIPFGFLFLSNPPKETIPIPDLRTVKDRVTGWISPDLRDLLTDTMGKQDWYRDYRLKQGAKPLPFIGRFAPGVPVADVAKDITSMIGLSLADRKKAGNWEEFLDVLMAKAEGAGVCVMRSGIVGGNTHRVLDFEEFRGFAICDDIVPVVFINGTDAKAAQIFTLAHELVHLWIGRSGIVDPSLVQPSGNSHDGLEKYCNAVAAELLLPDKTIRTEWNVQDSLEENADRFARRFRVSTVMAARRAYDVGFIRWDTYIVFYNEQRDLWKQRADKTSSAGGGNYYLNVPVRNGRSFTSAVVSSALEHRLLFRDAGRLLGISPSKMDLLARKMGIG
jgi:Zn-dependent peptidase ImmA (M78 family)/transcriptional regulator with XRE-family HTH domain